MLLYNQSIKLALEISYPVLVRLLGSASHFTNDKETTTIMSNFKDFSPPNGEIPALTLLNIQTNMFCPGFVFDRKWEGILPNSFTNMDGSQVRKNVGSVENGYLIPSLYATILLTQTVYYEEVEVKGSDKPKIVYYNERQQGRRSRVRVFMLLTVVGQDNKIILKNHLCYLTFYSSIVKSWKRFLTDVNAQVIRPFENAYNADRATTGQKPVAAALSWFQLHINKTSPFTYFDTKKGKDVHNNSGFGLTNPKTENLPDAQKLDLIWKHVRQDSHVVNVAYEQAQQFVRDNPLATQTTTTVVNPQDGFNGPDQEYEVLQQNENDYGQWQEQEQEHS